MGTPQVLPLSPEVEALQKRLLGRLNSAQGLVYALIMTRLDDVRWYNQWLLKAIRWFVVLMFCGLSGVFFFALMWAAFLLLNWIGSFLGAWTNSVLYVVPFLALLVGWALKQDLPVAIDFRRNARGEIRGISLGRLEEALGDASIYLIFLATVFGFQAGTLYFTDNHGGLPGVHGLGECIVLTLDNLCHGVFLDLFELYDIHFGPKIEHTLLSSTVFQGFRLAFDALAIMALYGFYQGFVLRRFIRTIPTAYEDVENCIDWLDHACENRRIYLNYREELFFLMLAGQYLRGRYEFIREATSKLPALEIAKNLLALFVDDEGRVAFTEPG